MKSVVPRSSGMGACKMRLTFLITASALENSSSGSSFGTGAAPSASVVTSGLDGSRFTEALRRGGTSTQNDRRFAGRGLCWSPSSLRLTGDCCTKSTMITSSSSLFGELVGLGSCCGRAVDLLVGAVAMSWPGSYKSNQLQLVYRNECVTDRFLELHLMLDLALCRRNTKVQVDLLFFLGPVLMVGLFRWKPLVRLGIDSVARVHDEAGMKRWTDLLYFSVESYIQFCPELTYLLVLLYNPATQSPCFLFQISDVIFGIHCVRAVRLEAPLRMCWRRMVEGVNMLRPRVCTVYYV